MRPHTQRHKVQTRMAGPVFKAVGWLLILLFAVQPCAAQPAPAPMAVDQHQLDDIVVRDRVPLRLLTKVDESLKGHQYDEATELLQRCFGSAEDNFVLLPPPAPEQSPLLTSSRAEAAKKLCAAGEPAWKAYETKYGIQARLALDKAEKEGSVAGYSAVIRTYEHTVAGATALDRLATSFFDRGEFDAAVDCWQQLMANPVHASHVTAMQRLKLLVAAQRCRRQDVVEEVTQVLGKHQFSIGGRSVTAAQWISQQPQANADSTVHWDEWRMLGGDAERNRVGLGSAPFLRPSVGVSLFDPGERDLSAEDRFAQTEGRARAQRDIDTAVSAGNACGFAGTPIIKGNLIVWRDVFGISAIDRLTHKLVWNQSTTSNLYSLLNLNSEQELRPFAPTYSRNSVLEQLSSDGQRIYYIDHSNVQDRGQIQLMFEPNIGGNGKTAMPPWNCLMAMQIPSSGGPGRVAWKVGGNPATNDGSKLPGLYFLGPPLPLGGMLYAVAEYQKMFILVALQPETGDVIWRQTLSFIPQASPQSAIPSDRRRLSSAVFLSAAHGILVCPLGSGVVIGIRQVTGELAWIQDYRSQRRRRGFPYAALFHNSNEQSDEAEFPNPPLIHGDRVYFLAPGETTATDYVYCFDLQSGKKIWQVETANDLKYLATVDDELLMAVGGSEVVGFLTQQGTAKWTRRVPRISGVGASVRGLYFLPLAEGRVLSLDPRDGTEVGFSMQVPNIRPGNLVLSGKDVISLNGLDLQIFPQSAELLASLEARPLPQRQSYAYWFELGELQFRIGQIKPAKINLYKALRMVSESEAKTSVRNVLRELVWQELTQQPDTRDQQLAEYAELCETPEQQAQHLLLVGEEQLRIGKVDQARQTASDLQRLEVKQPLKLLAEPDRQLNPSIWVADLTSRHPRGLPAADRLLEGEEPVDVLLQRGDQAGLLRLLQLHPNASWSARLRLGLARLSMQEGRTQAAELLLWDDHLQDNSVGLDASRFLLDLWEPLGLYEECGHLLRRCATELAAMKGSDGVTGEQVYANYPRSSLAWLAAQRLVPVDWKVSNVRIDEQHELDENLRTSYSPAPRYLYFPQSSQQLVTRGLALTSTLQQVDIETGSTLATITLASSAATGFFPMFDTRNRVGHFLPMGADSACFGISLLERGVAWGLESTPQMRLNNLVRVGPANPRLCVWRSRDRLFALDSSNGNLLWERNDLEETGRLSGNSLAALPGDREVTVLLESDSRSYKLYRTADGSFIRSGQLNDCYLVHHYFGRNLLYSVISENNKLQMRHIRLYDPLADRVLFEASDMATTFGLSERDPEFCVAAKSGVVRVVDGHTGQVKIEAQLSPKDFEPPQLAPLIKAFSDGTRYYINVNRQAPTLVTTSYSGDVLFPTQAITGDLYAIDPQTSRVLWTRTRVSPQNVVHLADYRLPFLVTLSKWRDRSRGSAQFLLRLEVIDGATGQTLASKNNAYNDRLLLIDYERDQGRLRLKGAVTQLELDFGRSQNRPGSDGDEIVSRLPSR